MTAKLMIVALALSTFAMACKSDDDDDELPEVDCATDVPLYTDVSAFDKCVMCHSSELSGSARRSAPADINFDTYDAAEMHSTKAAGEINEGAMPPAGSGITLSETEKDVLVRWALCGAME